MDVLHRLLLLNVAFRLKLLLQLHYLVTSLLLETLFLLDCVRNFIQFRLTFPGLLVPSLQLLREGLRLVQLLVQLLLEYLAALGLLRDFQLEADLHLLGLDRLLVRLVNNL